MRECYLISFYGGKGIAAAEFGHCFRAAFRTILLALGSIVTDQSWLKSEFLFHLARSSAATTGIGMHGKIKAFNHIFFPGRTNSGAETAKQNRHEISE